MKLRKNSTGAVSVKWKLFLYLAVFVGVMLCLLWLFQVVFLDSFYMSIKTNAVRQSVSAIAKNIDDEELQALVERLALQNGVCIRVLDRDGNEIAGKEAMPDCMIHRFKSDVLADYWVKAEESTGSTVDVLSKESLWKDKEQPKRFDGMPRPPARDFVQNLVCAKLVEQADGTPVLILLNSTITPVNATVETLRVQLCYITVILLVLAMGLALLLSRKLSRPIISISQSARQLAKGNYCTRFEGHGYREISELSDTLNYAAQELSKVEGLRQELIANISHDLRTPLTMIAGYGEVMRDIPGENTPENVQIIVDEAHHLTDLVNDILDLSKLQSGNQQLEREEFSLTQSIRDILKRYATLTKRDGYQIRLVEEGEAVVCADGIKISQVLYNLINNAITYTGLDKTVIVRQTIAQGKVKVEVIDSGEGIPSDKIPLIWDRYYKVDKAHKRAAVGTGLGLSIVKAILDVHGAGYGVTSTEGQGSIFWFQLDLVVD